MSLSVEKQEKKNTLDLNYLNPEGIDKNILFTSIYKNKKKEYRFTDDFE